MDLGSSTSFTLSILENNLHGHFDRVTNNNYLAFAAEHLLHGGRHDVKLRVKCCSLRFRCHASTSHSEIHSDLLEILPHFRNYLGSGLVGRFCALHRIVGEAVYESVFGNKVCFVHDIYVGSYQT
ncbi:P-loop containing nucleoside triphosphatehydrolases superfamily protein [Striga asiatica]|uniref:P-loop containing nucleoside triphosphatehydrolases superfamily protein n=1 Tax=Striga asiatica TaxID=4170 RepID=A0A5A7PGG1_STRAF|nr:P-loop containing nucleoside triphosphatehydrolases superfamily protein [Striga asiatica]